MINRNVNQPVFDLDEQLQAVHLLDASMRVSVLHIVIFFIFLFLLFLTFV